MTTEKTTEVRPGALRGAESAPRTASREERLKILYAKWDQFAAEYDERRRLNDQENMTNLRGLMLLIKKEIKRLGGELREFPYPDEPHLADL